MPSEDRARDLTAARARMRWRVEPGRFALAGFAEPLRPEVLDVLGPDGPWQSVREGGETTLLFPEALAAEIRALHPDARWEHDLVWIRFTAAMGWEVVGFLAAVTAALAEAGVPLGAVCGYSRDHVFVASAYLTETRRALAQLFPEEAGSA